MSQHVCARRILLEQQEDQPNEALTVRDVVVATRKVPMIEAVLGKKQ